ncbi:DUF2220 family protein [Bradyrhizobium elkanii]|uniref:DUF2220 family protein n=1 Tax=Bradyrhizobium elkanii TaxID=29448 RepID=UPI001AEA191E|nr:DUF2220 family protein [Bradyrhizobium elkanii]MBP2428856.1 hypothetical protein [Bradyrhizobium elkanii]WLA93595.1 DUF2220 family protein [Bradyrhizobium elkanii]
MSQSDGTIRVHRELQRLAADRGWLNGSRLVNRLADALAISHLEVRHNLLALAQAGVIDNVGPTGDGLGRVNILRRLLEEPTPLSDHEREWRDLISSKGLNSVLEAELGEVGILLAGLSRSDMEHLLDGFFRLVADHDKLAGRDPYEISAKYLLGSSKILGKLAKTLAAAGLSASSFGNRPRYMLGAGPAQSRFTLLIENPECLERVVALGVAERITVIATYGYGISWSGLGLEGRLDHIKIARVAGTPPATLKEAVAVETCFWGDLDPAGLDIFVKLRALIPHLDLSALYGPMLTAVADAATSHPYCPLVEKSGQTTIFSSNGAESALAIACRFRSVDQEHVSNADILSLADEALNSPESKPALASSKGP